MRNKFLGSIRTRMVAIYVFFTIIAFAAISLIVSAIVESFLVSQRTQTQLQQTTRLALEIAPQIEEQDPEKIYRFLYERARSMGGRVLVLDTDAVVQVDSASQQNGFYLPYREVRDILVLGKEVSYGFHRIARSQEFTGLLPAGDRMVWAVYYTAPITVNGMYRGAILFSSLIQDVENSVGEVLEQIMIVFLVVVVLMTVISVMLSNWLMKPIAELTRAIRRTGRRGYGRVNIKGSDEIVELGRAFNRMSERIEDHDRARDEFVSNASHELKTPLSAMKILSESILYEENPKEEVMREFFADVNHEVDRLTNIVNELLRLVQEDVAEAEQAFEPVELDVVVRSVAERLLPIAQKKDIALETDVVPVTIDGDIMRIEQLATNLIENALKYTDKGSVRVEVRKEGNEAVLRVSDTGIGMPKEEIEHIFERFYRVDKARSRGTGGTGIGLSIVERIVQMHGGTIDVESMEGRGSTFTVRIPLEKSYDEKKK